MSFQNIFSVSRSHLRDDDDDDDDVSHGSDSTPIFVPARGVVPMERNSLQSSPFTLQVPLDCGSRDSTPLFEPRKGCVPFEIYSIPLAVLVPEEILLGPSGEQGTPSDTFMPFHDMDLENQDNTAEEVAITPHILQDNMLDESSVVSALVGEKRNLLLRFVPCNATLPSLEQLKTWQDVASEAQILEGFATVFGRTATSFRHVVESSGDHHWEPCPDKVEAIADKVKMRIENGKKVIKAVQNENKTWRKIWTLIDNAQKAAQKETETPADIAVHIVYKILHGQANNHLAATGSSTYGEITKKNMESILAKISELNWIEGNGAGITIADLGAGYMLPLAHLAQRFPLATVVGIENCSLRAYGYASAMEKLLSPKVELMNRKFCYLNADLWQLQDLNWTNIVYMFDEAFPTNLVLYLYHLFMESTTTKYLISFKAGKHNTGNEDLLSGFVNPDEVMCVGSLDVHKIGSGELSRAMFYKKLIQAVPGKAGEIQKAHGIKDATMYDATYMQNTIELFSADVLDAHEVLFQMTDDNTSEKRVSKKPKQDPF